MICFHLYRIRKNVFIISFILFSSQNISPLGFCVADKIFGVLIEAMLWLPVSQKAWHEDLTATSSVEWGRRLQWKDIAPVTQMNSFTLGKGHGRESRARSFGAFVMEAGKTRQHREPLTRQVPHADLAGLLTPALVSICPGLPSLWRSLCLTLKIIFHKNSLLIPSTTVVWRSTVKTEEGVCCRVWALEGDWVPKVCTSGWDTNWGGAEWGKEAPGGEVPREGLETPGRWWPEPGPFCSQVTSVTMQDRDPASGDGQLGKEWLSPREAPKGPWGAWATGTRRSEARCLYRFQTPTCQLQIHTPVDSQGKRWLGTGTFQVEFLAGSVERLSTSPSTTSSSLSLVYSVWLCDTNCVNCRNIDNEIPEWIRYVLLVGAPHNETRRDVSPLMCSPPFFLIKKVYFEYWI